MSERTSRHALGYGTRPLEGTEELKRCPFCGGIGQLWIVCSYTHWMVECGRCKAHAEIHKKRADAIAAWNKRAGEAELAALRKLREAVTAAKQSLVSAMLEGPVESGMVSDHQRRLSAALNTYDETIKDAENE